MSSPDVRVPVAAVPQPAQAVDGTFAAPAASTPSAPVPMSGLTVGRADDPAEHAADRMADGALARLRATVSPGAEADKHAHDPGCGHLRRSPAPAATATVGMAGGALDASSSDRIESARGGGSALPDGVRRRMETGFGTNLSHVRVHDGAQAGALSAGMSAEAFTTGNDIFFGAGRFAPETPSGERVLAHEIAHVLTEGGSSTARRSPKDDKAAAKANVGVVAAEDKRLKEARVEGVATRKAETEAVYATSKDAPEPVPSGPDNAAGHQPRAKNAVGARVDAVTLRFNEALQREWDLYQELRATEPTESDEVIVDKAYKQVWQDEFKDLAHRAPERGTEAEKLVMQVRQTRAAAREVQEPEGLVKLPKSAEAEKAEKIDATVKKLPLSVQQAYERMVRYRDDLANGGGSKVLFQDEAYAEVKKGLPAPVAENLPPQDGLLDQAAWAAAESRVAASKENLLLLDPADRETAWKAGAAPEQTPKVGGPQSDEANAEMGAAKTITTWHHLKSLVTGTDAYASSVRESWSEPDPKERFKATKAGAGALETMVGAAKKAADEAKDMGGGVTESVKRLIPGLDLASAILSIVKCGADLATAGSRQHETDSAIFQARVKGGADKVDVMVYPLMKVSQMYTKNLEQACWSLAMAIFDLTTSVANVVTAGGFGIPKAVEMGKTVLDKLHTVAHFIAGKVLDEMALTANKESAVMHQEGGAENELKKNPKMAVDAIILKAAGGDTTAMALLSHYRIAGEPLTLEYLEQIKPRPIRPMDPSPKQAVRTSAGNPAEPKPDAEDGVTSNDALLAKVRKVVLEGMGAEADPKSAYEDIKKLAATKGAILMKIGNALGSPSQAEIAQLDKIEPLPSGVLGMVGNASVPVGATPEDVRTFLAAMSDTAIEEEIARTPRRNEPGWIAILRGALRDMNYTPTTRQRGSGRGMSDMPATRQRSSARVAP
ncbi:DUF4157 domain-containing protein [Cellulomonas sp. URHD0024]|uniref:eCIS core domain-containing protein n=1 Tax=Cellulomonas sp. URHD0024 TaxID=1302620 RepID=UPI0003FC7F55|nr:DUF4157 domain-containing protein [Cellulomonas sp. URHD0024]